MNDSQLLINFLSETVGEEFVKTQASELEYYGKDWTKIYQPSPVAVVLPRTTEEILAIVSFCDKNQIAIVPSGGRTGLAGAAVASQQELVVSFERMNSILEVDPAGLTIRAEAGATTQQLQQAAEEAGLFFPLDLAAKGSCQIGGNLATNAGGLKFIKYGGAREQLLGLKAVTPAHGLLDWNSGLRKNNTGYDLKQLLVASEGTLGLITEVTLKLVSQPKSVQLALLGVEDFASISEILKLCHQKSVPLTAFEYFSAPALELVQAVFPETREPFESLTKYYALVEFESESPELSEELLGQIFEDGLAIDGTIAQSSAEFQQLWGLRENITESLAASGHVRKNDISVEIRYLPDFVKELEGLFVGTVNGVSVVTFGHIGDGNIHINYLGKKDMAESLFLEKTRQLEKAVFELVKKYTGSISAEHGIGLLKKEDLSYSRSTVDIEIMKSIKAVFDPNGILNPGKIFDL